MHFSDFSLHSPCWRVPADSPLLLHVCTLLWYVIMRFSVFLSFIPLLPKKSKLNAFLTIKNLTRSPVTTTNKACCFFFSFPDKSNHPPERYQEAIFLQYTCIFLTLRVRGCGWLVVVVVSCMASLLSLSGLPLSTEKIIWKFEISQGTSFKSESETNWL